MYRILVTIFILISIASTNGYCVTQWDKAIPAAGNSKSAWPGQVTAQWSIVDTLISNYRRGENLTYKNATTITITLGEVVVSNSGASLRIFLQDPGSTDITTANLDSGGSFGASTTYYVYAAASSSTAASSTYYISASASAPTGPTYYVQLGSFITDGSANIVASAIYNNNALIDVQIQGNVMYPKVNVNLGTKTISNGFLGQTTTGTSGPIGNGSTYNVPAGCYATGVQRGGGGEIDQLFYSCP